MSTEVPVTRLSLCSVCPLGERAEKEKEMAQCCFVLITKSPFPSLGTGLTCFLLGGADL